MRWLPEAEWRTITGRPCPIQGAVGRWWMKVQPPRLVSALMVLIYLSCITLGAATVHESSFRIVDLWGRWLELTWAAMLIIGGLVGALAAPRGVWFAERAAVVLSGTASAMYAAGTFALHLQGTPGNQLMQLTWAITCGLFFATRWVRIQGAMLDPYKED